MNTVKKIYSMYHGPTKGYLQNKFNSANNANNKRWQTTSKNQLKNAKKIFNTQRKMGNKISSGSYGKVFEMGTDKRYVIKQMPVKKEEERAIFLNEILIGMIPGIERVGPKIYTFKIDGNNGYYIMDHVLRGETNLEMSTLKQYIEKFHPSEMAPVFKKLKTTIRNFWIVTKGYHGDLHADNIAVVHEPDGTVVRVMILDYGAHKRTKVRLTSNMTFNQLAQAISQNFNRSVSKQTRKVTYWPRNQNYKSTRLYQPLTRQNRRSNVNLLDTINFKTGSSRMPTRTLMNVFRQPRKINIRNYYPVTFVSKMGRKIKKYRSPRRRQKFITNYYKPPSPPSPPKPIKYKQKTMTNFFRAS